ncbi:hypothetical protein [Burkholderia pseudomallei]|nr:hypothetical protein [Burkholderia pseudomallei]
MAIIAFLVYTVCVFQAGRAEGEGRSSDKAWAFAFVSAIVFGVAALKSV